MLIPDLSPITLKKTAAFSLLSPITHFHENFKLKIQFKHSFNKNFYALIPPSRNTSPNFSHFFIRMYFIFFSYSSHEMIDDLCEINAVSHLLGFKTNNLLTLTHIFMKASTWKHNGFLCVAKKWNIKKCTPYPYQ